MAGAGVGGRRDRHGGGDEAGGRVLLLLRGQSGTAAFLERKELTGTELLVVEVVGGFDEVLEVGAGKELAEVNKVRVLFVLDCTSETMKDSRKDQSEEGSKKVKQEKSVDASRQVDLAQTHR